ncbi:MAG: VCBS repeat-containing protein [Deltaproteobacteria bacterium]|nr:VCBS repeat-containing protein [Deltaproteobacteria bacterium]
MTRVVPPLLFVVTLAACTEVADTGRTDTSVTDAPMTDTATTDTSMTDTSTTDTSTTDTSTTDTSTTDTSITDASMIDTSTTETVEPADTSTSDTSFTDTSTEADVDDSACSPPLALEPAEAWTHARELVTFQVTGGTGEPRFELLEASLGATLHPTLGIYLAGSADQATDVVRVTDAGCEGEATALVHIVPRLVVSPHAATVAPTTGMVSIGVSGGSGVRRFTLVADASGGAIDEASGVYHAGPIPALDRVRVTDVETGATADVDITVMAGAALALVPPVVALPVGARWRLATLAGSGVFETTLTGASVTHDAGWITAVAPGETSLTLHDLHTDETTTARAVVLAPLAFDRFHGGDGTLTGVALAPGDIDGDGHPDAILGFTEADVGHLNAGALYVYRGTEGGLDPTPARVFSGDDRSDNLGRAATVADLDHDGALDLIVASPLADPSGTNIGLARIYRGVPDAPGTFFEAASSRTFVGDDAGDSFGTAVAVCDFNGDGRLDLAVGANTAEDNTQAGLSDSGGIVLWLGAPGGFAAAPDQRIWGERPDGNGVWLPMSSTRLGSAFAVGDFDGDGLCDLAAASIDVSTGAGRSNDGGVWLFRGKGPDALSSGGLESHARLAWAGIDADSPSTRFGNSIAMGDLDGDGRDDLIVGQYQQRVGALASHGVVRVFAGKDFPEAATPPGFLSPTTADWTWSGGGGNASDLLGYTVALGDWDGEPPLDLLVTGLDDELAGGPAGAGVVYVLPGVAGAWPATTAAAMVAGEAASQRFGTLVTTLGDLDGDGRGELVARAPFDATNGPRVGRHLLVYGDGTTPRVALEAPQAPAGSRIGQAMALVPDLDGDGQPELAVAAPLSQADPAVTTATARAGVVALYRGGAGPDGGGFAPTAFQRIESFAALGTNDGLGDALTALDDFDGDGLPDLALLTARDSTGAACSPARNTVGAVHVFRGQAGGTFAATPSLTYWGEQPSQRIERVAAADVDGDGRTDLIVGSTVWDGPDASAQANVGAVVLVRGQVLGATLVNRCTSDRVLLGPGANDLLGSALAPLGDLDGDGCDDVAIGARGEDVPGVTNVGGVRVLFGWGAACAAAGGSDEPRVLAFASFASGATAGSSLAAGDLDGDDLVDLAIGAPSFAQAGNSLGAAWVVRGAHLGSLVERATVWTDLVRPALVDLHRFVPNDSSLDQRVEGRLAGELFGTSVAIVPPRAGPHGALVVAAPRSDLGGTPRAGAVLVYPWTAAGLAATPALALGGETAWPLTEVGASLLVVTPDDPDLPARIVVGAPVSRLLGLDEGAVLDLPLVLP